MRAHIRRLNDDGAAAATNDDAWHGPVSAVGGGWRMGIPSKVLERAVGGNSLVCVICIPLCPQKGDSNANNKFASAPIIPTFRTFSQK